VASLLQNRNLSFNFIFVASALSKPTPLRISIDNLDSYEVARCETSAKLDLAMYPAPEFIDDFVLVDDFAARDRIYVYIGDMSPLTS
jgi:hypothetical protein